MSTPTLSVVMPFFNEQDYIGGTLRSLIAQSRRPDALVLVDNGSSDRSLEVCRAVLAAAPELPVIYTGEPEPGKIHALARGVAEVKTDLVSLWDADTWYPRHYLARCVELASRTDGGVVAFMALDIDGEPAAPRNRLRRGFYLVLSRILRRQAFTGGYGQTFRTEALRRVGGFSVQWWPYVLLDHEIIHRVHKTGETRYDYQLWCRPSTRREDRRPVRWTLFERLVYLVTPYACKDWFFYRFLARRFAARALTQQRLRHKPWLGGQGQET